MAPFITFGTFGEAAISERVRRDAQRIRADHLVAALLGGGSTRALGIMIITKSILRWVLLLTAIIFFFIYLNGAFYRAWLASGPPTDNPEGWLFSAGNYLGTFPSARELVVSDICLDSSGKWLSSGLRCIYD